MSSGGQIGRSNSLKRKHWSIKAHETLLSRNKDGHFCINVEGGAEYGLFPIIGDLRQDRLTYKMGKIYPEELVLEVNHKRVPGMIKKDVIALIKRSADPVSLVTVKINATITRDIRQYLASRFTKNSVDSELQHQIRENLHTRVIPVTTRRPREGERDGVDYKFITIDYFKRLDKNGELLESGTYEGNYYGTPKPPGDPPAQKVFNTYSRSSASAGYGPREMSVTDPSGSVQMPRLAKPMAPPTSNIPMGPLPGNWEIAYTENNEKYFIDHNTGTTHWLDPRMARSLKHSLLECEDDELPYGWEKINDPMCGTYYIDHINRNTQYENPVAEAKRKYHASQLPNHGQSSTGHASSLPPPLRAPPSFQTAAALEKQREAEAAAQWPNAGLLEYRHPGGGFMPPQSYPPPTQHEIEENLVGEPIKVVLTKNPTGFGFTIIGGDRPGELLQIRSIVQGGVADRDGQLKVGDVLVRVNRESVVTYNHHKVVDLFQSIPMHSPVELEVRRGYPLPEATGDELPTYSESNLNRGYRQQMAGYPNTFAGGAGSFQTTDKTVVSIVKGPLGFGFSLSETTQGPVVKQIMDKARCAQLKEGDLILEVNGEKVYTLSHSDLITLLKRCPKGNTANFLVVRVNQMSYNNTAQMNDFYPNDYPDSGEEPFQHLEVHLVRQVSGFGFRLIGGKEEGSQVTIGGVVPGGAADVDGRLQVGDELLSVNGLTVMDATHKEVIQLIAQASQMGEVMLGIRRKMPTSLSNTYPGPDDPLMGDGEIQPGPREVVVHRPNMQTSFGFVLQSNTLRTGCMICRLIPGSPAERCGKLFLYDELIIVNGHDVTQMDHGDIVQLIKGSDIIIRLVVQQPENKEEILHMQQMNSEQPMQPAMAVSIPGNDRAGYPPQQPPNDSGIDSYEVGPQISADLDNFEEEEIHHIDFERDDGGFGFSIRGGAEFNSHMFVLRIAEGGAAEKDGRLKVGDELLEINGNSTEAMQHSDAITIIRHGGNRVQLIIRRVRTYERPNLPSNQFEYPSDAAHQVPPSNSDGSPGRVGSSNRLSASSKELLNGSNKSPSINTNEKYTRDYMSSLGRNRNSIQDQYGPSSDDQDN